MQSVPDKQDSRAGCFEGSEAIQQIAGSVLWFGEGFAPIDADRVTRGIPVSWKFVLQDNAQLAMTNAGDCSILRFDLFKQIGAIEAINVEIAQQFIECAPRSDPPVEWEGGAEVEEPSDVPRRPAIASQ